MNRMKAHPFLLGLFLLLALLLVSACSSTGGGSTGGGTKTLAQTLQDSANAMKQLKTVHFQTTSSGAYTGQSNGSTPSTGAPTTGNGTFNLTGSGDVIVPDQQSVQVTLNSNTNLAEIYQGDKVYVKNTQGQWYVLNKSVFSGYATNPLSGVNMPDVNSWLGLIQNVQLTDHGTEALNGLNVRHITAKLDKTALRQILTGSDQVKNALGTQNIDEILDATKSLDSTLDVWIDEASSYVQKTELKFNLAADLSSVTPTAVTGGTPVTLPRSVSMNFDSVVNLSRFNETVTITPPSNAIPTDNPGVIFGGK